MKYRKKPVVIEAFKCADILGDAEYNWKALPECIREAYEKGGWIFSNQGIHIPTLEGTMIAGKSDWIIKGIKGEFYPCKPDIFEMTYEKVE